MKLLTSSPDLGVLPPPYVNVVGKALAKNPAHRHVSMLEMAKEVEAAGRNGEAPRRGDTGSQKVTQESFAGSPRPRVAASPPVLSALPVVSPRQPVAEFCGSVALVPA